VVGEPTRPQCPWPKWSSRAEIAEPTSALDAATMKTVEKSLVSMLPPLKTQHSGVSGRGRVILSAADGVGVTQRFD
jgi:hypothetical protein